MDKTPYGKLAATVIERASNRAVRVSYKPTLAKQISESPFMVNRGQGIEPDQIFEAEQTALVDMVWNALHFVLLLGVDGAVHPLPHDPYVAQAQGEGAAPAFSGQRCFAWRSACAVRLRGRDWR